MKKITKISLVLLLIAVAIAVIYSVYWPFASGFFAKRREMGDAQMHIANIVAAKRDLAFPISSWKTEWGGYPLVEGYPWFHYYLIQPVLNFFANPGLAMDFYSAAFLLIYYIVSFLLLLYVSRNVFVSLLFSLVLVYGADSQMPFMINAFMTFTASMVLLPLILLVTIIARERRSIKGFLLSSMILSLSFYSHGAMTFIIIFPVIIPFLLLDNKGKISKESLLRTFKYFAVFAFLSSIQIYQFIDYSAQGYLRGVKPFPLEMIPPRLLYLFSWQNPVLLPLLVLFVPLFLIAARKSFSRIKPYLFSLLFLLFFFTLMVFNITSMNLVLLAERVLWALSLMFLLLFAVVIRELVGKGNKRSILAGAIGLVATSVYLYLTLVVKLPYLVPDTLGRDTDPYRHDSGCDSCTIVSMNPNIHKYPNKYDYLFLYPPLTWSKNFDNYRGDGISYNIYSLWNIFSSNPRYKGRFPAAKGLPLEWSGLVSGAEYGMLGEAGTPDTSQWAINQAIFFFDWYAIKHFEIAEGDLDLANYLREKPLIASTEKSWELVYHSMDEKYVGPIYAPTNTKTMAVVSPEIQYDNFIRTLSYSEFTSKRLIPIYLGPSMGSLNKKNLADFDAVFLLGYKKSLLSDKWALLADYVKSGGNLIIETGQKVQETQYNSLPEVFPVQATKMTVVTKLWSVEVKENEMTKGVNKADFSPFTTKYLPYSVSEASPEALRGWAKPVLTKDGSVVMAFGQLEEGNVVWSGINLPFHAIDNRNTSETVIFANILEWFFPEIEERITDFEVSHPKPEVISIKSSQGKGFLLKENYNPGWSAKLNGKKAEIYKAGLFQMYIPFDSSEGEQAVELKFGGVPFHWLLFLVSTVSFIGVMVYLLTGKNLLLSIPLYKRQVTVADEEIHY